MSDDATTTTRAPTLPLARVLPFVLVLVTLSLLIHLYLVTRLAVWPAWPPLVSTFITTAIWAGAALVPLGNLAWRIVGRERAKWLSWTGLTWMGTMYYLFFGLLPFELVRALAPASAELTIARVAAVAVASIAVLLTLVGSLRVRRGPIVAKVTVRVGDLAPALEGLRIVQLSDVHVGPTIGRAYLADVVAKVRALDPHIVCITGDLIDGTVAEVGPDVALLAEMRPSLGTYFTTGNHEYYSGHEQWLAFLPTLGIEVLRNRRVRITHGGASLDVAGIPDLQGARFGDPADLEVALAGRAPDDRTPLVVLAHQPKQAIGAAARGATLVLSGHTHAGQLAPFGVFAKIGQPSIRGLVALPQPHHAGMTWLYTSEGTGYWGPPLRVGTRSEVTLLTLVRA